MDKVARMAAVQRMFEAGRAVTIGELADRLDCSIPTAKRALRHARHELGMPIEWDSGMRAYILDRSQGSTGTSLPGLWLSGPELSGLVTLHRCLGELAPSLIGPLLAPLGRRLGAVLARSGFRFEEVQRRVKILAQPYRPPSPDWDSLAEALLQRRRVEFTYDGRSASGTTRRTVSPQRMVLYRGNWYLDAWCHLRDALRSFAVERIRSPQVRSERAKDVAEATLDEVLATSYGIFSGSPNDLARLRFSAFAARWVADEWWHPHQTLKPPPDGWLEVTFPIGRREELVLDVLRWGPEVEVLEPSDLRREVGERLARAAAVYRHNGCGSGIDTPGS